MRETTIQEVKQTWRTALPGVVEVWDEEVVDEAHCGGRKKEIGAIRGWRLLSCDNAVHGSPGGSPGTWILNTNTAQHDDDDDSDDDDNDDDDNDDDDDDDNDDDDDDDSDDDDDDDDGYDDSDGRHR